MTALTTAQEATLRHVRAFFEGHHVHAAPWSDPTVQERLPGFGVIRVSPGPLSTLWTYVSAGCWDATHDGEHGLEFVLIGGNDEDPWDMMHLAVAAFYHCNPDDEAYRLDHGHTVPLGQAYADGSAWDHLLVTLPYPYGPELERCEWDGGHARLLWLLPITAAENRFRHEHGLEALEQRFDDARLPYWDRGRPSLV